MVLAALAAALRSSGALYPIAAGLAALAVLAFLGGRLATPRLSAPIYADRRSDPPFQSAATVELQKLRDRLADSEGKPLKRIPVNDLSDTAREVAERLNARLDALSGTEKEQQQFIADVSHELRTPLTVLVGFLETVRELKLDPQRVRDYLGMMQEQAARMQRIIEDLLTLSALDGAPPASGEKRIAIGPLLHRLKADAEALSGGRHSIRLEAETASDVLGIESEVASALGNLVSNAIRYTPPGGVVALQWREGPDGARFTVEDTGIGIEAEHIPRLTERFYRVDRSRSRETGGTGLGLAIAKHALARHDEQTAVVLTLRAPFGAVRKIGPAGPAEHRPWRGAGLR